MPFNLGGPELIIVLVIVLIVFGAGKLPSVMRDVGKGVKEFKRAQTEEEGSPAATMAPSGAPGPSASAAVPPAGSNASPATTSRPTEPAPRA
jgi:sec-independent protein translocase protein TatA